MRIAMRAIWLSMLYWLMVTALQAQQPFAYPIDFDDNVETAGQMTVKGDTLYFLSIGWSQTDTLRRDKLVLHVCDLNGNVYRQHRLMAKDVHSYEMAPFNELPVTNDGHFLIVGQQNDRISPTHQADIFVAKVTRQGDTVWTKTYPRYNTSEWPFAIGYSPNGMLIITGARNKPGGNLDGMIVAIDTATGQFLWENYIDYGEHDGFSDVEFDSTAKEIIVSGGTLASGMSGFRGMLWYYDYNGKFLRSKMLSGLEAGGISHLSTAFGGRISLQKTLTSTFEYYPHRIRKYDKTWNVEWTTMIDDRGDDSEIGEVFTLPDGSVWMVGWAYTSTQQYAQVLKLDSTGTIVWHRRYFSKDVTGSHPLINYANYYPGPNAVYAVGTVTGPGQNNSDSWLVRFDSMGCLVPGCDTLYTGTAPMPFQPATLHLYPNPGTTQLTIDLPPDWATTATHLQLRNLRGQIVHHQAIQGNLRQTVATATLPAGLYLVEVWSREGLLGREKWVKN